MRLSRAFPALVALLATASVAKADTIEFTATITQQFGLYSVPVGSTYTGFAHYGGSVDPNFTGVPPVITSYGFNYPSAPVSVADLKWAFLQRHATGDPLFVGLAYVDFSSPAASFDIIANEFFILTPTSETANGFAFSDYESGTVTYTYVKDPIVPVSPVPEPASLALVSTGVAGALASLRRRTRNK